MVSGLILSNDLFSNVWFGQDFLQVQSGVLLHFLRKVIVFAAKHVQQCGLCSQKGFICLICESPKIIYPFDTDLTIRVSSTEIV